MRDLKPILDAARLYEGDNGRIFCGDVRCAGQSAAYSGFTISGLKVRALELGDVVAWDRILGRRPRCEGCGREALLVLGSAHAPATLCAKETTSE